MSHWGVWIGCHFPAGAVAIGDGEKVVPFPLGADGDVLTIDLMEPSGLKWSPPGGGGVASVASAGNTLIVTNPTTTANVEINVAHANVWTADQELADGANLIVQGSDADGTVAFIAEAANPGTNLLVTLPTTIFGIASATETMATPEKWVSIKIGGVIYRVPCYLPHS